MSEPSKKRRRESTGRVSWISLNFGILLLLFLIVVVGWAAWSLPRDRSTDVSVEIVHPVSK